MSKQKFKENQTLTR